jgi:hypothetical protein
VKQVTLLVIFLAISTYTNAQEFDGQIYGGLIASQIDGDTYAGYNKPGIIFGGAMSQHINKKWAWQIGLRYAQKGSVFSNAKIEKYYKAQLHYAEMPITFHYYHFKKISFELGVSANYLIKAMEDKDGYGLEEATPPFKQFELSSVFGAYYHFSDIFAIGGHYSYSITAIRPYSSGNETFMDKGQYNNLFYFAVYYKLSAWI